MTVLLLVLGLFVVLLGLCGWRYLGMGRKVPPTMVQLKRASVALQGEQKYTRTQPPVVTRPVLKYRRKA